MLQVFGRYVLVRRIAAGGMGEVFLARQTGVAGFDRTCVVKFMHRAVAEHEEAVSLFLEEARLTARLTHSHIAQVYDFGKIDGIYFLAIEWVDGLPLSVVLRHHLLAREVLPFGLVARLISQAAQGLDYAHRLRGADGAPLHLVHRDVSTSNLMLSREGMLKIIDFGIAKARTTARTTRVGEVRGNLRYMSPEQRAGEPLDGRSDIFSLGLVLYELLTGTPAVTGRNELEMMLSSRARSWTPVELSRPDAPAALVEIVRRTLAPLPAGRFASMADLSDTLEAVIAAERWPVSPSTLTSVVERVVGGAEAGAAEASAQRGSANDATDPEATSAASPPPAPPPIQIGAIPGVQPSGPDSDVALRPTEQQPAVDLEVPAPPTDQPVTAPAAVPLPSARGVLVASPPRPTLNDRPTAVQTPPVAARLTRARSVALIAAGCAALVVVGVAVRWSRTGRPRAAALAAATPPAHETSTASAEMPASEPPEEPGGEPWAGGRLDVSTEPAMEISIDGQPRGTSPKAFKLPFGPHRVVLRAAGQRLQKELRVVIGAHAPQRIEWHPSKGSLEVRVVPPWAEVNIHVDGVDHGTTPAAPLTLWEGDHTVSASTAAGWSATKKVMVPPGGQVSIQVSDGAGIDVVRK